MCTSRQHTKTNLAEHCRYIFGALIKKEKNIFAEDGSFFVNKARLQTHSWMLNALPKDTSCGCNEGGASGANYQPQGKQRFKNEALLIEFTFPSRKMK